MSNQKYVEVRLTNKKDTSKNWEEKNPIILDSELIFVETEDGKVRYKLGDRNKHYNELDFIDENSLMVNYDNKTSIDQIDHILPKKGEFVYDTFGCNLHLGDGIHKIGEICSLTPKYDVIWEANEAVSENGNRIFDLTIQESSVASITNPPIFDIKTGTTIIVRMRAHVSLGEHVSFRFPHMGNETYSVDGNLGNNNNLELNNNSYYTFVVIRGNKFTLTYDTTSSYKEVSEHNPEDQFFDIVTTPVCIQNESGEYIYNTPLNRTNYLGLQISAEGFGSSEANLLFISGDESTGIAFKSPNSQVELMSPTVSIMNAMYYLPPTEDNVNILATRDYMRVSNTILDETLYKGGCTTIATLQLMDSKNCSDMSLSTYNIVMPTPCIDNLNDLAISEEEPDPSTYKVWFKPVSE